MKVLTKNGTYYINKFLLEQIKQNNPEILLEKNAGDIEIFNKNVRKIISIIFNKFNYSLDDRQKKFVQHYLNDYSEKIPENELEYQSDNFLDIQNELYSKNPDEKYLADIAYNILTNKNTPYLFKDFDKSQIEFSYLNKSDIENNVVDISDIINQNIEKQAAEQNGDTQSADVQQPEQQNNQQSKEKNKSNTQDNPQDNNDTNNQQPNEENKSDNQNEADNELKRKTEVAKETWEKTQHIVQKINIFANATQTIIQRAMYAIKMTLNIYGSDRQNDNFMKKFGSIVSGGYDYQYMANVDKSLALKYYLAALENVDSETYDYVKNGLFYDKNNKFINYNQEVSVEEPELFHQTQIEMSKTSKELNNAVQSCVILFEVMNEQDINNMYNAILYDEILSSNYKMNSLRKLSAYGFRDQIIYFTKKVEGAPNLICLFVFRQKAREVRGIGNFAKKFGSNIVSNTPKVL